MSGFVRKWHHYKGPEQKQAPADYYGMDVSICVADESFFPSRKRLLGEERHYEIRDDGWGRIVRLGKGEEGFFSETLERVLEKPEHLGGLAFDPVSDAGRYSVLKEQVAAERAAGRCIFAKVGGIYIRSHFLRGEDKLLMDMALDEGFCNDLFDRVANHLTGMALQTLQHLDAWETGLWVYDDMANNKSTMFSPAMFERYLLPRYKRMIETCREAGCRHVFLHSDGNIGPVLDMLLEAGFEGFNPLEPRCGLDLLQMREKYGRRMVFFGGMCNTGILPRGDRREIEAFVRPLLEMGREGGLVLGSASINADVRPEAYDYYMSAVRRWGNYCKEFCFDE